MSNNILKQNTLEMEGGGLFGDNAKEYFIKNVKTITPDDTERIKKYVGENYIKSKEADVDKFIKDKIQEVTEDTLNNYWKTFTGNKTLVQEIILKLQIQNDTINDITFAKLIKDNEAIKNYYKDIIKNDDDAGQEYKKVKVLIKFIQNVIIENEVKKPKESAVTSNIITVTMSNEKPQDITKKDFYEIKLMDKFYLASSDGTSNDETKYNNYIKDYGNTYRKKAIDKINKSLKDYNVSFDKLKYLDHIHESDTATKELINSTDGVSSKKLATLISDRSELLEKLKAIFQEEKRNHKIISVKDNFDDVLSIQPDLMNDLYAFINDIHKEDYYTLTSWIKRDIDGAETYPRTTIQIKKEQTSKIIGSQAKTTDKLVMIIKYNIFDKDNYSKTFMDKDYTTRRVLLEKSFGDKIINRASKLGSFLGKKMGFSGGKTHKRRPKATKKKNIPVKQKFTRKHRGGLAFSSKVEQIRLMDELMNSDDYMNDAAEGIREALKESKTGPLVYGLKNQASSSPFNFHEFMADIFIPGTRDYKEKLNKIKNAYIVDKDNRIYLVKTSNVVRKLRSGNNRLKITFTPKLVPKLWLKSAMTDDRINKDQLRDELQRKAGTLLTDKSDSDAKIRGMITRKDNTYTFNEDKYQKNYGKKLLNIIKNLKLPNPESYITEFENHNHDDLDSESITYDKSIDVEILFKKATENMGTTYTDLSSLPDYKKYLEAKTKQEKKSKPLAKEPKIEEVPENLPPPPPTNDGAKKMAESSTGTDTPVMVDSSTGDNATVMTESSTGTDIKEMKDSDSQTDMPATAKVVNTGVLKKKSGDVVA